MAPLKSLCSERLAEWQGKLQALGYTCLELTSDSPFYETEDLLKHTLLIATPEKIHSMLRSQEGMKELLFRVTLLMIDEVRTHFLNCYCLKLIRST